jgi:enoyl-CoA hydratase
MTTEIAEQTTYATIEAERIGAVLRLTLNRPEKRNALSGEMQQELIGAIEAAQLDKGIRAIIIRGAGPSFCAGYDMTPRPGGYGGSMSVEDDVANMIAFGRQWARVWDCRIPVIAQVHGYCVAGGTDLALHCDMVIVADDAQLGFPPVRAQGGPPTHMWVYNCGPQWSKRILLTGDTVSGETAARIGLALESVPADELNDHVLALAQRVATIGHDLLAHNKRVVNLAVELMGRSQMQTIGAIHDVLAHQAPEAAEFSRISRTDGLRAALDYRDSPFNG